MLIVVGLLLFGSGLMLGVLFRQQQPAATFMDHGNGTLCRMVTHLRWDQTRAVFHECCRTETAPVPDDTVRAVIESYHWL